MINEQSYRYLTGEEMKGFGDDSAPIDVTRDERCDMNTGKQKFVHIPARYRIDIYDFALTMFEFEHFSSTNVDR